MRLVRSPRIVAALVAVPLAVTVALSGCSSADTGEKSGGGQGDAAAGEQFPDVENVKISADGDGAYTLEVTMSSPYDSPDRYADGWRVLDEDGDKLATMTLGHDHADEQPFTRSQVGLEIPSGVNRVTVEGHDQDSGYGGMTQKVDVPNS